MQLPAFIDLQASGTGPHSYPIEVGFVDGAGQPFCSLVQPVPAWVHWEARAEAAHGIRRELLFSHGRSAAWIATALNERLAGQTVYCDGGDNDAFWIGRLFAAADCTQGFELIDVHRVLDAHQASRWHRVLGQVRDELSLGRHRASSDAKVLQIALGRVQGRPL